MRKEDLKKRALSMVQLPNHFQPLIEEYVEQENGTGEAIFSWSNEEKDEYIMIDLDLEGNLTSLTIDLRDEEIDFVPLKEAKRRELAEQFLLSHYPDALTDLTLYKTKPLTGAQRFYFEQLVMDIPLDYAGCFIDIDPAGRVVGFRYEGIKKVPEIPQSLISKDKLMEHLKSRLDFQLIIVNMSKEVLDVAEDGLRLIYELVSLAQYKADVMEPTLTIIQEELEEKYAPLPPASKEIARDDLTIEKIIGITEEMEIIREVDMGEETGIVWRDRDWDEKERDLTWNGLFMKRTEDTIKAYISKKTGKVRSFIWFNQRSGNLQLTQEECYQKAIEFLQMQLPDYYQHLHLIVQEDEDEVDDSNNRESFTFHLSYRHGVLIQLYLVMVNVNCKTGLINHYSGPRFDLEELNQIPTEPTITKKEATDIFFNHLDFELEWNKNYESETEEYNLVYGACNRDSRAPIRYIDAITGAVISERDY